MWCLSKPNSNIVIFVNNVIQYIIDFPSLMLERGYPNPIAESGLALK